MTITVDTFENRIFYLIDDYKRLDWGQLNDLLLKDIGYKPNPNYLHSTLIKLKDENRIVF
jgi:hypothetical protein